MPEVDPVIRARNKLAGLYAMGRTPDPASVASAKRGLTAAKLERAVREAVDAIPPLTEAQREDIAQMLRRGVAK